MPRQFKQRIFGVFEEISLFLERVNPGRYSENREVDLMFVDYFILQNMFQTVVKYC